MNCNKCNQPIPEARLKAVPNTTTCVGCSTTKKVGCHTVISGKTEYSELQILSEKSAKEVRKHVRQNFGAKVELSTYAYLNKKDADIYNLIEKD